MLQEEDPPSQARGVYLSGPMFGFKKKPIPEYKPEPPSAYLQAQLNNAAATATRPPPPQVPNGCTRRATWLPHDKQYSYLHIASEYVQFGYPDDQTIAKYASQTPSTYSLPSISSPPLPPPSQVQSPALPEGLRGPPPPPLVTTATGGSIGANANTYTENRTGATILALFDVPGNWSGKGQHVEFARNEHIPVEEGISLGRGASADVHEVVCRGVKIARKQIFCSRRMKIEDVKRELEILRKLDHKHVVTLLGSYTQRMVLGILLFPAAVCDLGVYLDELDEDLRSGNPNLGETMSKICERLEIPENLYHAKERLNRIYGCLANAVQYLHDNDVRHKDLKPRNILLDRNDGLFVTDFGLSKDTTDASTSVTNGIERGTYKYCAPEVARYEPRGRAADIYSLGCVFLEINTVHRKLSLVEFDTFRTKNEDHSFQNSPEKLQEWMTKLRAVPTSHDQGIFDLMDLVEKMVADSPTDRPVIAKVIATLKTLGGDNYFASCCSVPPTIDKEFRDLATKYKKVKGFYFEKAAEMEKLEAALKEERMKVQDMAEEIVVFKAAANTTSPNAMIEYGATPVYRDNVSNLTLTPAIAPSNPSDPDDIFSILDKDSGSKGYLTWLDTKDFFENYIPARYINQIWRLADVDSDDRLTREEFDIAFHLMRGGDQNKTIELDLPNTLPPEFIPPSMRKSAQSAPSFQTNIRRQKTKKWVQRKPVDYGGDDWGDDDDY
ncbi:kinase-like protein [Cadophora sp. DSE1049]|nr:kinase-like protein [Cadophora sp. DSE1049]